MKDEKIIEQIEKNLNEMKICNEKLKEFKEVMDVIEKGEKSKWPQVKQLQQKI